MRRHYEFEFEGGAKYLLFDNNTDSPLKEFHTRSEQLWGMCIPLYWCLILLSHLKGSRLGMKMPTKGSIQNWLCFVDEGLKELTVLDLATEDDAIVE
jgi:hypothetical protein